MVIDDDKFEEIVEEKASQKINDIREIKWTNLSKIKKFIESAPDGHCIKQLRTLDLDRSEISKYLYEIEYTFEQMERESEDNKKWFKSKLDEIIRMNTRKQTSSNLGEFCAYSVLKNSEFGRNLKCMTSAGCDFTTEITINHTHQKINIEVNTPLENDDKTQTTIDLGTTKEKLDDKTEMTCSMSETSPFGLPERPEIDTVCSEVISKINRIKSDEHQFDKDTINILFINFVNPFLSDGMDLLNQHGDPIQFFNAEIFYGNIWYALYSKKGEIIPLHRPMYRPPDKNPYTMEYDGKLIEKEKLTDFIIFNMYEQVFIFEKSAKHLVKPIKETYKAFLTIRNISWNRIWMNYPYKDLLKRIKYTKKKDLYMYNHVSFINEMFKRENKLINLFKRKHN